MGQRIVTYDSAWLARELERLAPLVPEAAGVTACEAPAFAVAFVERYAGDVPQIELASEFLLAVLGEAWRREDDAVVVRVASGLAHVAGRLREPGAAERALRVGIEAAQRLGDGPRLAHLLHCLGCLEFAYGRAARGWRLWRDGMELAETCGTACDLWRPLGTFAHSSDILARFAEAGRYLNPLALASQSDAGDDPAARAVALFIRAFHTGWREPERAYDDLCDSLRLIAMGSGDAGTFAPGQRQVFTLTVQAELARVRGDYARASAYAQSAVELARVFADRYTVAALLFDSAMYAYRQGRHDDARARFRRMAEVAGEMGSLPIHERGRRFYETRLVERTPDERVSSLPTRPAAHTCLPEPLSAREREVLRLVAAGLANREIAVRLVVTEATVKKHLEHVYGKLDARSRTAALAAARALRLLD